MAEERLIGSWRVEMEMLAGSETFKNHFDIIQSGLVGDTDDTPTTANTSLFEDLTQFFVDVYYPDVTIVAQRLRGIYFHRDPLLPIEHPPIWEIAVNTAGVGNTTFGGTHNANYLPADVCIYMKKTTSGGRNGKVFFRNILTEVDVGSGFAGLWSFSGGSGHFQESVWNGEVAAQLAPYFDGGADTDAYDYSVTHLEVVKPLDTRDAYGTVVTSMTLQRPTWNRAKR